MADVKVAARRSADVIWLARSRGALPRLAKMTFQALRILLNDEFGEVRRGMQAAIKLMDEAGALDSPRGSIQYAFCR